MIHRGPISVAATTAWISILDKTTGSPCSAMHRTSAAWITILGKTVDRIHAWTMIHDKIGLLCEMDQITVETTARTGLQCKGRAKTTEAWTSILETRVKTGHPHKIASLILANLGTWTTAVARVGTRSGQDLEASTDPALATRTGLAPATKTGLAQATRIDLALATRTGLALATRIGLAQLVTRITTTQMQGER